MSDFEMRGVSKTFGNIKALDNVTFSVKSGEIVGFVGANGAGKTTAMRIIMGVLANDSGEVLFDALPADSENRRRVGYMPSERGLYPKEKVRDQLEYFALLHGMDKLDAKQSIDFWLDALDVSMYKDSKLETLSTGNQQRVQLTSALAFNPNALILDEPFSGLDPIAVDTMGNTLRRQAENGIPVLFSSHQLELIDEFCDRVIIIKQGKIVTQGTPDELRKEAGAPPTIVIPTPLAHIFKDLLRDVPTTRSVETRSPEREHAPTPSSPTSPTSPTCDAQSAPVSTSTHAGGKNE